MIRPINFIFSLLVIIPFMSSCVGFDVEEEYLAVCDSTTVHINRLIENIDHVSCFDASYKIDSIKNVYINKVNNIKEKIGDNPEKKKFFNSIVEPFSSLPAYTEALPVLEKKAKGILDDIQGEWWIMEDIDKKDKDNRVKEPPLSQQELACIFSVDSSEIKFLNNKTTLEFKVRNGALNFKDSLLSTLYIDTISAKELMLHDSIGNKALYKKATESDLMTGRWLWKDKRSKEMYIMNKGKFYYYSDRTYEAGEYYLENGHLSLVHYEHPNNKKNSGKIVEEGAFLSLDIFEITEVKDEKGKEKKLHYIFERNKEDAPANPANLFEN